MKQHRHFFPGYVGPSSSNERWWHSADMIHRKYPTAHDGEILEERIKGEVNDERRPTPIRKDLVEDPEATRAKYQLERM